MSAHLSGGSPPTGSVIWLADAVEGVVTGYPSDASYVRYREQDGDWYRSSLATASGVVYSTASSRHPHADLIPLRERSRRAAWGQSSDGISLDLARGRGEIHRSAVEIGPEILPWGDAIRLAMRHAGGVRWSLAAAAVGTAALRSLSENAPPSPRVAVLLDGTLGIPLPREMRIARQAAGEESRFGMAADGPVGYQPPHGWTVERFCRSVGLDLAIALRRRGIAVERVATACSLTTKAVGRIALGRHARCDDIWQVATWLRLRWFRGM